MAYYELGIAISYSSLTLLLLILLVIFCCESWTYYHIHYAHEPSSESAPWKLTVAVVILYFICNIISSTLFALGYLCYYKEDITDDRTTILFIPLGYCSFAIALTFYAMYLLLRLKLSFDGTVYSIDNKTIVFLICLLILFIASSVLFGLRIKRNIEGIVIGVLATIYVLFITHLFSSKLLQLTIRMRQSIESHINNDDLNNTNGENIDDLVESKLDRMSLLSEKQTEIIEIIAKQTVLAFFTVMCAISWSIAALIYSISKTYYTVEIMYNTVFIMVQINVFISAWFSFVFSNTKYYIVCGKFHQCCWLLFQKRAVKKIRARATVDISTHCRHNLIKRTEVE